MSRPLVRITDDALPAEPFHALMEGLQRVGTAASYWRTFWYPLSAAPSNVVEATVPHLLHHVPHRPHHDLAGVEWWIGRMHTHRVLLDFHHDRDLELFEETGRIRHPVWSSVLFCTSVKGGSLFVTDQRLVRRRSQLVLSPSTPSRFGRARPHPNRFALFPGELFHGVLDARDEVPSRPLPKHEGELRLSLVVNWWDRPPRGVRTWSGSRAYRALAIPSGRSAAPPRMTAR